MVTLDGYCLKGIFHGDRMITEPTYEQVLDRIVDVGQLQLPESDTIPRIEAIIDYFSNKYPNCFSLGILNISPKGARIEESSFMERYVNKRTGKLSQWVKWSLTCREDRYGMYAEDVERFLELY
jgi:hypothetical protein